MENLTSVLNWIILNKETLVALMSALFVLYRAWQEKKTGAGALQLVINVLKDEAKATDNQGPDGKFIPLDTIKIANKLQAVAETVNASPAATAKVTQAISAVNQAASGHEDAGDIKVGSYKGKPIYLGKTVGAVANVRAIWNVIRGK